MATFVRWLGKNRLICAIVAATFLICIAISVVEADVGEPLVAILAGLTLVVSAAILAAAVTAAIYAKPAYDQAVAMLQPAKLELNRVSLRASSHDLRIGDIGDGFAVYYATSRPCSVRIIVSFTNTGRVPTEALFNFRSPVECDLRPLDDPAKRHYLTADERHLEVMPGVSCMCRYSAARALIPADVMASYALEISIPDEICPWPHGWPMQVLVRGVSDQLSVIDNAWWVSVDSA